MSIQAFDQVVAKVRDIRDNHEGETFGANGDYAYQDYLIDVDRVAARLTSRATIIEFKRHVDNQQPISDGAKHTLGVAFVAARLVPAEYFRPKHFKAAA